MITVSGTIRLTEFKSVAQNISVPCLEMRLTSHDDESAAASQVVNTVPLDDVRQFSLHPGVREAMRAENREIVTAALRSLTAVGCAQLRKAVQELQRNVQATAGLLKNLGHEVVASEAIRIESLEGDDNFPTEVTSDQDLARVGPALFNDDMIAGWLRREIMEIT